MLRHAIGFFTTVYMAVGWMKIFTAICQIFPWQPSQYTTTIVIYFLSRNSMIQIYFSIASNRFSCVCIDKLSIFLLFTDFFILFSIVCM